MPAPGGVKKSRMNEPNGSTPLSEPGKPLIEKMGPLSMFDWARTCVFENVAVYTKYPVTVGSHGGFTPPLQGGPGTYEPIGFVGFALRPRYASSWPEVHGVPLNSEAVVEVLVVFDGPPFFTLTVNVKLGEESRFVGIKKANSSVPVTGPLASQKPNVGRVELTGVTAPLSEHAGVGETQKP